MNVLDRLVAWFSPRAGCERIRYREALRNYDANRSDRFGNWRPPPSLSPERTDAPHRNAIRGKARDLERNNDVMQGVIGALERNVVGTGIHPQALVVSRGGVDQYRINDRLEELWAGWARKENCDITGCSSFYDIQRMFVRRKQVDGEVFVLIVAAPDEKIPFKLQIVEPDLLAEDVYESNGHKVHGGVEVDEYMKPVAYHFRLDEGMQNIVRVEASRAIHSFWKTRPQQLRGISGFAGSMERVRDIGEYIDAELKAARAAAANTGVVVSGKGAADSFGRSRRGADGERLEEIHVGMMNYVTQGDDVKFPQPGRPNVNAAGFITAIMRMIGIAGGLSYEVVSRDLSQVNYSSARQGHLEDRRTYQAWQLDLIDNLCRPVWKAFVESAVLAGLIQAPGYWNDKERYQKARWVAPGWPWIDPQKEATAAEKQLNLGIVTLAEICGSQGRDWQETLEQRKREQDYIEELGLKLGGTSAEPPADQNDDKEGEDDDTRPKKPVIPDDEGD